MLGEPLVTGQLNCQNHPFFEACSRCQETWSLSLIESSPSRAISRSMCVLAKNERTILEGLWSTVSNLEGQSATKLSQETILKVVEAVAVVEEEGVHEWIDHEIGKILKARDHRHLTKNADQLRERVIALQQQLDEALSELEGLEALMVGQGTNPASSSKHIIISFSSLSFCCKVLSTSFFCTWATSP